MSKGVFVYVTVMICSLRKKKKELQLPQMWMKTLKCSTFSVWVNLVTCNKILSFHNTYFEFHLKRKKTQLSRSWNMKMNNDNGNFQHKDNISLDFPGKCDSLQY